VPTANVCSRIAFRHSSFGPHYDSYYAFADAILGSLIPIVLDLAAPGARSSGTARTRLIDDLVQSALNEGVEQVVILVKRAILSIVA
jgi:hypothetical protein